MSKYYYKIVNKDYSGNLYSLNAPDRLSILYTPGEWVKPVDGTGGIFIFKTYEDAFDFYDGMDRSVEIWKCKVKSPRKLEYRAESGWSVPILNFWKDYFNLRKSHKSVSQSKENFTYAFKTPKGTYIASEIMLIKKV